MRDYQRGQILLIVVLIMVTALTIGLSVAARSVTNTRTSEDSANSEKAFSAAEAGIEQSLASNNAVNGSFNATNNITYKTTFITVAGTSFAMNNGSPVLQDSPVDLWLSTYPSYTNQWSGTFTIYWGKSTDTCTQSQSTNTMAALEIIVLSGTSPTTAQSKTYNVDPCSLRAAGNGFQTVAAGGGTVAGTAYNFDESITVTNGLLVRIVPLYASTGIAVTGCNATGANCNALPVQGTVIQSTGTAENTQRQIVTYRYNPSLPSELFQYNFFAP